MTLKGNIILSDPLVKPDEKIIFSVIGENKDTMAGDNELSEEAIILMQQETGIFTKTENDGFSRWFKKRKLFSGPVSWKMKIHSG